MMDLLPSLFSTPCHVMLAAIACEIRPLRLYRYLHTYLHSKYILVICTVGAVPPPLEW